jgi:RimJ/RimL family protein N-acetyltransferase
MPSHDDDSATTPLVNMVGERVALGPLHRDLIPLYATWRNDFWIQRTYGSPLIPTTIESQTEWFERESVSSAALWFTIYERESMRPIGLTDLFDLEQDHGIAWWGMAIGEADCRGKGYAAEVARLMLDYAFTALNLHTVVLTVDEFNMAARRAYTRAGFRESGRIRGATHLAGKRYDRIVMDCIASEFESPVLRAILEPEQQWTGTASLVRCSTDSMPSAPMTE